MSDADANARLQGSVDELVRALGEVNATLVGMSKDAAHMAKAQGLAAQERQELKREAERASEVHSNERKELTERVRQLELWRSRIVGWLAGVGLAGGVLGSLATWAIQKAAS